MKKLSILLLILILATGCATTLRHPDSGTEITCRGHDYGLSLGMVSDGGIPGLAVSLALLTGDIITNLATLNTCVTEAEAAGFVMDPAPPSERTTQEPREGG